MGITLVLHFGFDKWPNHKDVVKNTVIQSILNIAIYKIN